MVIGLFFKFIPNLTNNSYTKLIIILIGLIVLSFLLIKIKNKLLLIAKDILNNLKKLISTKRFIINYISAAILFVFLTPLMLHFIFLSLSIQTNYSIAFIAYWLSLTIGFISGIPGGFGARELTMGSILMLLINIDIKTSILIVLSYRIISILPHILFGSYYVFTIGKDIKELIKNKQTKPEQAENINFKSL